MKNLQKKFKDFVRFIVKISAKKRKQLRKQARTEKETTVNLINSTEKVPWHGFEE